MISKLIIKKIIWRMRNSHNFTKISSPTFPLDRVSVDIGTYGNLNVVFYGNDNEGLEIGRYCSIADDVTFLLGGEHDYESISTFPFASIYGGRVTAKSKGKISVQDDVWIGFGATILSGVTIGKGAVIGARALVVNDVEPYSIVGGVPAHLISYRFDEVLRNAALGIDYSKINPSEESAKLLNVKASVEKIRRL